MLKQKLHLILWCVAAALMAYVSLDYWSTRNAPLHKKFERQWREDVALLEESKKLPEAWYDIRDVEIVGGTPETRKWLRRITTPEFPDNPEGQHKLEILIVVWEEDGKKGVLVQYNLVQLPSQNMVFEIGRTLILAANARPRQ